MASLFDDPEGIYPNQQFRFPVFLPISLVAYMFLLCEKINKPLACAEIGQQWQPVILLKVFY